MKEDSINKSLRFILMRLNNLKEYIKDIPELTEEFETEDGSIETMERLMNLEIDDIKYRIDKIRETIGIE